MFEEKCTRRNLTVAIGTFCGGSVLNALQEMPAHTNVAVCSTVAASLFVGLELGDRRNQRDLDANAQSTTEVMPVRPDVPDNQ
jgi:hypothetical protein